MSEKKNKGGRPRKYATGAERSKAYYERKKAKMKTLEEHLKKLESVKSEGLLNISIELEKIEKFDWQKITPSEISLMDIQKLEHITKIFREKIMEKPAIKVELQNLIRYIFDSNILEELESVAVEDILRLLDPAFNSIVETVQESNQQQTLLYLMEAELANRERLQIRDYKLEILQSKVEELKKERKEEIELRQKK
ncbi:MAG: hypothetical protein EAX90_03535 [Candidatus Heimdallarchaeota archaeon]|nr:hypothetical protein [Candidatus Heimdallarchaeota archaeon]